jgi:hypothetical protein
MVLGKLLELRVLVICSLLCREFVVSSRFEDFAVLQEVTERKKELV